MKNFFSIFMITLTMNQLIFPMENREHPFYQFPDDNKYTTPNNQYPEKKYSPATSSSDKTQPMISPAKKLTLLEKIRQIFSSKK